METEGSKDILYIYIHKDRLDLVSLRTKIHTRKKQQLDEEFWKPRGLFPAVKLRRTKKRKKNSGRGEKEGEKRGIRKKECHYIQLSEFLLRSSY